MDIFESLENLNVSEECFDEIMGIVEELILERNKENRQKKKDWEMNRTPETSPLYSERKKHAVRQGEEAIKGLKKNSGDNKEKAYVVNAVDEIARGIRANIGREQDPVSFRTPSEVNKLGLLDKDARRVQSQRGSTKDPLSAARDRLADKQWKKGRNKYN